MSETPPSSSAYQDDVAGGGETRFAVLFIGTLAVVLGLCYWITGINKDPYPAPVDLRALAADEVIVTNRLDERTRAGLKMQSAVAFGTPAVAAFGSHAIKYLTSETLGIAPGGFMNFYVMHIGLPDIAVQLRMLESAGRLPGDLILVHLHNPHSSNWSHISQIVWDLPLHYYLFHSGMRLTNRIRFSLQHLGAQLRDRLNYRIVLYELILGSVSACVPPYGKRRIAAIAEPQTERKETREAADKGLLARLGLDRGPNRVFHGSCSIWGGFRHDGSFAEDQQRYKTPLPVRQNSAVKEEIPPGGAARIASLILEIAEIARRNGTRAVFFAPPVFEIDRTSVQDRIFSDALATVAGQVTVLDHRKQYRSPAYFRTFLYPSDKYFRALGTDLRKRGLIGTGR